MVNVDWFLVSHFLPLAERMLNNGYKVHVLCKFTTQKKHLRNLGFVVHNIDICRGNVNIFFELKTMWQMYRAIKRIAPDIVEFYTIKPVIYGGIISRFFNINKKIFYITGLGYIFINRGLFSSLKAVLYRQLYKIAIKGENTSVIVENSSDESFINSLGVVDSSKINLIKGAGVDLNTVEYVKERIDKIVVVMASRLLIDKGVFEFVKAAKIIKNKGIDVEFKLYGDIDKGNPASLKNDEIHFIKNEGVVEVCGFTENIMHILSSANIIVLPSYREGFPKILVEAAACGRAVVTTDVPGCRDVTQNGITGLLCNSKDEFSLVQQIEKLILDSKLRTSMGRNARKTALKDYDQEVILKKHISIIE